MIQSENRRGGVIKSAINNNELSRTHIQHIQFQDTQIQHMFGIKNVAKALFLFVFHIIDFHLPYMCI